MAVYTVHEPPPKHLEQASDPERFAFVRDGFSFSAFLFGPLWMLRHRMWLVLILYGAIAGGFLYALYRLDVPLATLALVVLLLRLLVGFEAATLRRITVGRRGFANVGVIVG